MNLEMLQPVGLWWGCFVTAEAANYEAAENRNMGFSKC